MVVFLRDPLVPARHGDHPYFVVALVTEDVIPFVREILTVSRLLDAVRFVCIFLRRSRAPAAVLIRSVHARTREIRLRRPTACQMLRNGNVHDPAVIVLRQRIIHPGEAVFKVALRNRSGPNHFPHPERIGRGAVRKIFFVEIVAHEQGLAARVARFVGGEPTTFVFEIVVGVIIFIYPLDDLRDALRTAARRGIAHHRHDLRHVVPLRLQFQDRIQQGVRLFLIDIHYAAAAQSRIGEVEIQKVYIRHRQQFKMTPYDPRIVALIISVQRLLKIMERIQRRNGCVVVFRTGERPQRVADGIRSQRGVLFLDLRNVVDPAEIGQPKEIEYAYIPRGFLFGPVRGKTPACAVRATDLRKGELLFPHIEQRLRIRGVVSIRPVFAVGIDAGRVFVRPAGIAAGVVPSRFAARLVCRRTADQ